MEFKPNLSFTKGNMEGITVVQSGNPIEKKEINQNILDYIYERPLLLRSFYKIEFHVDSCVS